MLNSFRMDKENMLDFYKQINRKRPKLIIGYANSLKIFAHFILSQNLEFKNSDFNLESSAEVLTGESRAMIEKAFNAKVFNSYGSREIAAIAHECNYFDGLHVNEERMHLEGIPMNETKKVALTDLTNFAFPLIRYENGDLFEKFDDSPCKCGRSLIRIKHIIGRTADFIKMPNGKSVHGEFFTRLFYSQDLILEFRLVQDALDHVFIEYVPSDKDKGLVRDFLQNVAQTIHEQIDSSLKIDFVEKERIERTDSGKYNFTKSLI